MNARGWIMLKISTEKSGNAFVIVPLLLSLLAHGAFYGMSDEWARIQKRHFGASSVEIQVRTPAPAKPEPAISQQQPAPLPEKRKPEKLPQPPAPAPNTEKPVPPSEKAAEPVFGVTADSVADSNGGVAVRVGNTLEKSMEKEFTPPSEVGALSEKKREIRPVPAYELTVTPTFKIKVEPDFPEELRKAGVEGVVQLELLIGEEGRVLKIRVLQAPDRRLASAAIAAAKKSLFNPGMMGDRPVPVKIKIPYRFVLES